MFNKFGDATSLDIVKIADTNLENINDIKMEHVIKEPVQPENNDKLLCCMCSSMATKFMDGKQFCDTHAPMEC